MTPNKLTNETHHEMVDEVTDTALYHGDANTSNDTNHDNDDDKSMPRVEKPPAAAGAEMTVDESTTPDKENQDKIAGAIVIQDDDHMENHVIDDKDKSLVDEETNAPPPVMAAAAGTLAVQEDDHMENQDNDTTNLEQDFGICKSSTKDTMASGADREELAETGAVAAAGIGNQDVVDPTQVTDKDPAKLGGGVVGNDQRVKRRRYAIIAAVVVLTAVLATVIAVVVRNNSSSGSSSTSLTGPGSTPATSAPSSSVSPTTTFSPSTSPSTSPVPSTTPSASPRPSLRPTTSPSSQPTTSPEPSLVPSNVPSLEPTVSSPPTNSPSGAPSSEPTQSPTMTPSLEPSFSSVPTMAPTGAPSLEPSSSSQPSRFPTNMPSVSPTNYPTTSPSVAPSLSQAPSFGPFDPNFDFRLRLHWQDDYFWQETSREMTFCMECCECEAIYFAQFPNCRAASCGNKKQLWLQKCNRNGDGGILFNGVHVGDAMQIKLDNRDLCVTRREKHVITLEPCVPTDNRQLWKPISAHTHFELTPYKLGKYDDSPYCGTQHHHPKPGELVGLQRCSTAHSHETGYWIAF